MPLHESLISEITSFYLRSSDFNGLGVHSLLKTYDRAELIAVVADLIGQGLATAVFGDYHPNPHIKAFPPESSEEQIAKLHSSLFDSACLYPSERHLKIVVDPQNYQGKPFELYLALGEHQLSHRSFDLAVLEPYRNDPRFSYNYGDIEGTISISTPFYENTEVRESDQILLESFGFSFDSDGNLYVAAFLRYLANLSPEHQQIWASKQVSIETRLHPAFHDSALLGKWPERIPLFEAVLLEMQTANDMATAMGRPVFWLHDYRDMNRPKEFGYLLRPTSANLNSFIHLLDKMLSENINREFFKDEVSFEEEIHREDGKIEVRRKGSIQVLGNWLDRMFRTADRDAIAEMLKILRKIRKMRGSPAHSIKIDEFDQRYFREQISLVQSVYRVVKTVRLILGCHPLAQSVEVNRDLEQGRIWAV